MIHLVKGPKPDILTEKEAQWTEALLSKIEQGLEPTKTEQSRYRNPQIKAALVLETHGKCAYCESKLLHIHHGDVEHIHPKSLDPSRTFEWANLTLACEICNQNKSNKDPFMEQIIDPYLADPTLHLMFSGALVFPRGTIAGISTRTLLDLNRGELAERRKEQLERIMTIVYTISCEVVPLVTRRALFSDLVNTEAHASKQYTAMVRAVVDQARSWLPTDVTKDL